MKVRKKIAWTLAVLALPVIGVFTIVPRIVDDTYNTVDDQRLAAASPRASALHQEAFVADLHADSLLWKRDLTERHRRGHIDFPRLRDGNVAFQVFSAVTQAPRGQNYLSNSNDTDNITALAIVGLWPTSSWFSLEARAHYQAQKLHGFLDRLGPDYGASLITTSAEFADLVERRKRGESAVGTLLAIEGAHCLEGDFEAIDRLFASGYRMVGLAHFFDNELAGSAHGITKYGLTEFGIEALQRFEELEMIVDVAHSSEQTITDVLARSSRPVVVSHGGVRGTCESPRNLSDHQLDALAQNGALIGIGYWPGAVCEASPKAIARAIRYVADRIPTSHLALGSDFDGNTHTPIDTSELVLVTEALVNEGFNDAEVRAIIGGNARRFFTRWLPGGREND